MSNTHQVKYKFFFAISTDQKIKFDDYNPHKIYHRPI